MHRPKTFALSAPPHRRLAASSPRLEFYREEFLKLHECLQSQRELFSEGVASRAECALSQVLAQLDQLAGQQDADVVVSDLLRRFDVLARLAAWTDSRRIH
jgi:hypothetical protein